MIEATSSHHENTIPKGWENVEIQDIYDVIGGGTPSTKVEEYWLGEFPWITSADIHGEKDIRPRKTISRDAIENSATNLVPQNTIIVVTRVSLGKVAITPFQLCFSQDSQGLIPKGDIVDTGYSLYFLSLATKEFQHIGRGTTISGVTKKQLKTLKFPLAPLPEQKRIVAKIEELFTQLDVGVAALKRAQANLKRYKASVLKAACEGRLVPTEAELYPDDYEPAGVLLERILKERQEKWGAEEWQKLVEKAQKKAAQAKRKAAGHPARISDLSEEECKSISEEDYAKHLPRNDRWKQKYKEPAQPDIKNLPELPEGWVWGSVDGLSIMVTSGSRGWARYYSDEGDLFVRVGNFSRNSVALDYEKLQLVNAPDTAEGNRTRLVLGDLLITITADVGISAYVDESAFQWGDAYINQHVGLIRPVNSSIMKYVAFLIESEPLQNQVRLKQYGATKKGLGLEDVKALSIPIAPMNEQRRIVQRVERLLSVIQEQEEEIEKSLKRAERLRQAILKRAFEGNLVPQNPEDEPASVLLERVKEEDDGN